MFTKCNELITTQQGTDKNSPVYWVGKQLRDIVKSTPGAAAIVAADLVTEGMTVTDCEKKIKEYADAHKSRQCGVVPPHEADRIIREFYGINKSGAGAKIELADLL